jgi:predicted DNA-binding transcriptional regulator AlpA
MDSALFQQAEAFMLPSFVRYRDLKQRGIVSSWPQLRRMQEAYGFPTGRLLGANIRAWTESEIEEWLAKCPVKPSQQTTERAAKSVRAKQRAVAA